MPTTSQPYPRSVLLHAITHSAAVKKQDVLQQDEPLSSDVIAFCTLLARIMMRCLKEQDEQALQVLSLSSQLSRKE